MSQAHQTNPALLTPEIVVIDSQGGGLGCSLIYALREKIPSANIVALGTNSAASIAMLKAGASKVATGENSIVWNASRAKIIVGGIGIVCANSMLGEISPSMANAVASSDAYKFLIPMSYCQIRIAGTRQFTLPDLVEQTVNEILDLLTKGDGS